MSILRVFGIKKDGTQASWSTEENVTVQTYLASIKGFNSGCTFLAFDADAPENWPSNIIEWSDDVQDAFNRADFVGDPLDAIVHFNAWALYHAIPEYTGTPNKHLPVVSLKVQPGPRKPVPAIPPEIHATKPFDPVAAWEAVKALSKGS